MDRSEKRFCVYLHTRPDTNKVFYVGIGVKKRPYWKHERNNYWHKIVSKNNGEFIVDILCDNQSFDSACQIEKSIIKFYGRRDNGTGILANMTDGGEGTCNLSVKSPGFTGGKHTQEVVERIRAAAKKFRHTEEHKKWIGDLQRGRKMSDEQKEKLRIAATGRKISEATREKFRLRMLAQVQSEESKLKRSMTLKGRTLDRSAVANSALAKIINRGWTVEKVCVETGKILDNYLKISDAAEAHGLSISTVSACIKQYRGQTTAGGYHWRQNHDKDMMDKLVQSYSLA